MKKFLVTVLFFVALFLVSCSSKIAGVYKFESMKGSMEGISVDVSAGGSLMGMTIDEDYMVVTLYDDGTVTISTLGTNAKGTWEASGSTVKVKTYGETQEFKHSGKKLTIEEDGLKLTLVRTGDVPETSTTSAAE